LLHTWGGAKIEQISRSREKIILSVQLNELESSTRTITAEVENRNLLIRFSKVKSVCMLDFGTVKFLKPSRENQTKV